MGKFNGKFAKLQGEMSQQGDKREPNVELTQPPFIRGKLKVSFSAKSI